MTQQPNSSVRSLLRQPKILIKRLAYLGSLSVFSSGVAFSAGHNSVGIAQTPVPIASPSPASRSADVVVPIASSPTPTATASPQSSPTAAPEPVAPKATAPVVVEPPAVVESPAPKAEAAPKPQAPSTYQAPTTIVITDRKSGCEFAVAQGQAVSGRCGNVAPTTTAKATGIGNTISKAVQSVIRPKFAAASVDEAPVESIASNNASASWTPPSIVPPSFVQDFYNRTVRPLGLPGNGDIRLMFPLSIPAAISSIFGWRVHPISGSQSLHTGTDLAAPMGTPVVAALTGRVIMSDFFGGYGLAIALEHTNGTQQTLYGHLSEIFVKPGDVVKQGTVIGRVGSTGNSTGPHLHFEFRQQTQDGTWVAQDPGLALEQSMAQLVKSMQVTQQAPTNTTQPRS